MVTYQVDDGLSIGGIIDIDIDKVIDEGATAKKRTRSTSLR